MESGICICKCWRSWWSSFEQVSERFGCTSFSYCRSFPPILIMKRPRAAGMLVSLVIKPIGGSFTPFAETIEIVVRNAV